MPAILCILLLIHLILGLCRQLLWWVRIPFKHPPLPSWAPSLPRALNKGRKALMDNLFLFFSLPCFTRIKVAICQKLIKRSEPELTSSLSYFTPINSHVLLAVGCPSFHISYSFLPISYLSSI